jgi:hypothetical protein
MLVLGVDVVVEPLAEARAQVEMPGSPLMRQRTRPAMTVPKSTTVVVPTWVVATGGTAGERRMPGSCAGRSTPRGAATGIAGSQCGSWEAS